MIHEDDRYELPKEIMEMSHEQIKIELEKEREKMVTNTNRKPKKELACGVAYTFIANKEELILDLDKLEGATNG